MRPAFRILLSALVAILLVDKESVLFVPVAPPQPGGALFASASERAYLVLGCLIGAAGGPLQAASRTLLIRLAPKDRIAQYFGLFALTGKVTSFIGPLLIGAVTAATANQKAGMAVLVGRTNAGKSTLLNLIAGFLSPSSGEILLDGKTVTGPGADRSVVFQKHALLPWLNVLENVAFGLKMQGVAKEKRNAVAAEFIALLGLTGFELSPVYKLSGGMQQRVGIARALSITPKIMLMDEPFSALDALTRGTLQDEVRRICLETGQTAFMITHDVDEAIYLADKIFLMTNGPGAVLAEVVENPLPKDRGRIDLHRHPYYYALRNHIVDFLVSRSKTFVAENPGHDPRHVPVVRPGLGEPALVAARADDPNPAQAIAR